MNFVLDLILLLIGAAISFACYKKGLLKSVIQFFKTILAFLFAHLFGGALSGFLSQKWIAPAVRNSLYQKIHAIYQDAAGSFDAESVISSLPDFLVTEQVREKLYAAGGSGEELVGAMTDAIASPIATVCSNVVGYLGVFLLSILLLSLLALLLNGLIDHIPLIGRLNHILGLVLGLLIAATVLLVMSSLFKFIFAQSPIYTESTLTRFLGDAGLTGVFRFLDVGGAWFSQSVG